MPRIVDNETGLTTETDQPPSYICCAAPGWYGDTCRVLAVFSRVEQARAFARRGATAVYEAYGMRKGDTVYRVDVQNLPNLAKPKD